MEKQLHITKDGQMVARKDRSGLRQLFRRMTLYVGLQFAWGGVVLLVRLFFLPGAKWMVGVQWAGIVALWYLQCWMSPLKGMDITFESGFFDRWDVIKAYGLDCRFLIFKKTTLADGNIVYRCFPFDLCRTYRRTAAKLWWFRFLIAIKLIK